MLIASPHLRQYRYYISHIGHLPLLHPWLRFEFCKIPVSQEQSASSAFPYVMVDLAVFLLLTRQSQSKLCLCSCFGRRFPAMHLPPSVVGLPPKNTCKYTHYFTIAPILLVFFYSITLSNALLSCFFVVVNGFMVHVLVFYWDFMADYKAVAMRQVLPLGWEYYRPLSFIIFSP